MYVARLNREVWTDHFVCVTWPDFDAYWKEVQRWRPSGPFATPHRLMEDDEYNGYRLPAWGPRHHMIRHVLTKTHTRGATVIGNLWAIGRDAEVYGKDVEDFR